MAVALNPGALEEVAASLRAAGCVYAEDEADQLADTAADSVELTQMVAERVSGVPLEVIVGWAEFSGLRIGVEQGVFVPRRRTEIVVQEALALARPGAVVVDLCCGTGAIGAAIHAAVDDVELWATDIDPAAVHCARRNIEPLGGTVLSGDLFAPLPESLRGRIDLLVVNAPYVPSDAIRTMPPEAREHEPRVTLDGGADGLHVQRRVTAVAAQWLSTVGALLIETSRGQAPVTAQAFSNGGLHPRVVTAEDVDGTVVVGTVDHA